MRKTHPYIKEDNDLVIIIRPLRNDSTKSWMKEYIIKSFSDEEYELYVQFIINIFKQKIAFSLYFSIYGVDISISAIKSSNGEISKGSSLSKSNTDCVQTLSADIDGLEPESINAIYQKLLDLDLETICIWSGHGIQFHILLNKPCMDLLALSKFNDALQQNGFDVDKQVRDCSRILRLGFFNMKAKIPDNNKYQDIIKVEQIANTNRRYEISDIFKKLGVDYIPAKRPFGTKRVDLLKNPNALETYKFACEHEGYSPSKPKIKKVVQVKTVEPEVIASDKKLIISQIETINLQELYPMLHISQLSVGFRNMLYGFREGYADNTLMFIVARLHHYGFSLVQIQKVTSKLAILDTFNWSWDEDMVAHKTEYFFNLGIHNVPTNTFKDLEEEFGPLKSQFIKKTKDMKSVNIHIPRTLFTYQPNANGNQIAKIKSAAFVLYLNFLLDTYQYSIENPDQCKMYLEQDIIELSGRKRSATRDALENLTPKAIDKVQIKLVSKKKAVSKRDGAAYRYFVNPINKYNGYIEMNFENLKYLLDQCKSNQLSNSALMLYFYMIFRMGENDTETIAQFTMALATGISQSQIQRLLVELEAKKLITISKNGYRETNKYCILNYNDEIAPIVSCSF
ncbi:hypothetical protein [[Clostridium] fimetarium]|uniref:Uncharacterized protein n=1 Tax=[Clostridium] fimetarium TaxID=99656 RepID=A0A1I0QW08_9FIRM|nr:hypothetical protein [[Clostridium] fimetarium]SEW31673.1 hypothetical protein SAMN05421659_109171 [[Clostridium] fimetarium]